MHIDKWDLRYLGLSQFISRFSKDPSTQVGCVIVRPDKTIASFGFNGFARGVVDSDERLHDRKKKYPLTIHAELNAVLNAKEPLRGCIAYVSTCPCAPCASVLVQAGITHIVAVTPDADMISRWGESFDLAQDVMDDGDVGLTFIEAGAVSAYAFDELGIDLDAPCLDECCC